MSLKKHFPKLQKYKSYSKEKLYVALNLKVKFDTVTSCSFPEISISIFRNAGTYST